MTRIVIPALLALLPVLACTTRENACSELRSDLKKCGLSATSLDCNTVDTSTLEAMVSSFTEQGCDGAAKNESQSSDVDPRLCKAAGWACPDSPTPAPSTTRPQYPIVLVSGIDESAIFDWNPRIANSLNKAFGDGAAYHVKVKGWSTTPDRAADLWDSLTALQDNLASPKINLVCYAVGGLDCRYLVSPHGLFESDKASLAKVTSLVASITTISTPHRGTRVADAALAALSSGTAADIIGALAGSSDASALPSGGALQTTLQGLTMDASLPFNQKITDADGVFYQSFAGVSHVLGKSSAASDASIAQYCAAENGNLLYYRHPGDNDSLNEVLWVTAPWSSTSRGDDGSVVASPSDGMVSVASAKWGHFRGCIPADHYDVIGQIGHTTRDGESGFDAPLFYQWVASGLAEEGL